MKNAIIFLIVALVLAACVVPSTPAPSPTATSAPTSVPSDTPQPTLSPTATVSSTPTEILPPTAPFFFSLPTFTPTPLGTPAVALQCQLISQSIADGTEFKARERFDVGWNITNTGTAPWIPGNVDFAYFAGTKMHKYTPVQLPASVASGETVNVVTDMLAPKAQGKYKAIWSLRRGNDYFCRVSVTINVP